MKNLISFHSLFSRAYHQYSHSSNWRPAGIAGTNTGTVVHDNNFVSNNGTGGSLFFSSKFLIDYITNSIYTPSGIYTTQKVWLIGETTTGSIVPIIGFGSNQYQFRITNFEYNKFYIFTIPANVRSIYVCMDTTPGSYNHADRYNPIYTHGGKPYTFKINLWNHNNQFTNTTIPTTICPGETVNLTSFLFPAGYQGSSNIPHWNTPTSNGTTITWSDGTNIIGTGQNISVTPTTTTTYTPTFTVGTSTTVGAPVTITVNHEISLSTQNTHPKCYGETGAIQVATTGSTPPYTYNWSDANGSLNISGPNAFGLSSGNYTIEVVSSTGCTNSITTTINPTPSSPISLTYGTITAATCLGINDGQMQVTVGGGIGPYTVNWSSSGTINTAGGTIIKTGLAGGKTYTITVQDANGCIKTFTKYIGNGPSNINTGTPNITDETCLGIMDGEISLNYAPTCTYTWQSGQNSATISNLEQGTYTVTATANNTGCQVVNTYTIGSQSSSKWHVSTDNHSGKDDKVVRILTDNSTNDVYVLGEFTDQTNIGGTDIEALHLNTGIFVAKYNECGLLNWQVYTQKTSSGYIDMNAIDMVFTSTGIRVFGKTNNTGFQLFKWKGSNAPDEYSSLSDEVFSININTAGNSISGGSNSSYPLQHSDVINEVAIDGGDTYFAGQFNGFAGVKKYDGNTITDPIQDQNPDNEISAMVISGDIYAVANLQVDADFVGSGLVPVNGQTEAVILKSNGSQVVNMLPAEAHDFVHTTDIIIDNNNTLWVSGQFNESLPAWDSPVSPLKTGIVLTFDTDLHPHKSFFIDPNAVSGFQESSANALSYANNQLYVAGTFIGNELVIGNQNYGFTVPSNITGSGSTSDLWMAKYDYNNSMFNWIEGSNSADYVEVNDISFDGRNAYIGGAYKQNIDFSNQLINLNRPQNGSNLLGFTIRGGDISTGGGQGLYYKTNNSTTSIETEFENVESTTSLLIYPNPNDGIFTLSYNSSIKGNVNIRIYDVTGSLVYLKKLNKELGKFERIIDLNHLNHGVYLLNVEHNNSISNQKFLIK